jgi:DNA-binding NarL/FixJ family response regulator
MLKELFFKKEPLIEKEIKEIGALVLKRIEKKIDELKAIEKRIDEKIDLLKALAEKAEEIHKKDIRHEEVINLYRRGLKIDDISNSLGIPSGEVDLILRMCKDFPQGKDFLSKSRHL